MSGDVLSYTLGLRDFALQFVVKLQRSMEETHGFQPDMPHEFAFVVAKIELTLNEKTHLVSSEFNTGNLIEFLKELSAAVTRPTRLSESSGIIVRGGVCAWMRGYWGRIDRETATSEDESTYDSLSPLCVTSEDGRCIAIYEYGGVPTFEVSAGGTAEDDYVTAAATFDPTALSREIDQLREAMTNAVRERMTVQ